MSVQGTGGVPTQGAGEEAIELPAHGDAAFGALMDALAPEPGGAEDSAAAGEAGAGAGAPAPGATGTAGTTDGAGDGAAGRPPGGDQPPAAPAPSGAGDAGAAGADGAEGTPAGDPEQPAAPGGTGDRPAGWTADAASFVPKLGSLSTALEENTTKAYQQQAFEEVREEHANYFEALNKHPRLLVGTQVPAIGKEGFETLSSTTDAKDWQEAVKSILVQEVNDRAGRALEENSDFLSTVHASIELFQNNTDLVPGTKDFNIDLANRFAKMAEPYELRVDGKLQGYSIPVQPLINQLRSQLAAEAKPAAPAAPSPAAGTPATPPAPAAPEPPQAGIRSKAGNSSDKEDFSTLFGTIGLPNIQI